MDFVHTLLLLAVCLIGLVVLRLRWRRLSRTGRKRFLAAFLVLAAISAVNRITHWETTNEALDFSLAWIPVLLYSTLVIFFTRLHPRWLTVLIAAVMLLPVFSTSALGPMSGLLRSAHATTTQSAVDGYELSVAPWGTAGDNSGLDFNIVYRRGGLPGLRRGLHSGRLYNSQCQTAAAHLEIDRPHDQLRLRCPALPASDGSAAPWGTELVYPLH